MKYPVFFSSLMVSLSLLACPEVFAAPKPLLPDNVEGALLRLSGSNTIGAALAPSWSKAFLESGGATHVSILETDVENEYRIEGRYQGKTVFMTVSAHGSSTGFRSLEAGTADIAMASRAIKTKELGTLKPLGNLLSYSAEHVVAIDGVAVIVHPDNPLEHLSLDEIAKVFSGQVRNWSQLGGDDIAISVFARDGASGTWDTFKTLVLQKKYRLSSRAQRFESNDRLAQSVSNNKGGIGFVGLSAINGVKALAVENEHTLIRPTKLLVATEDYPLSRRLFLYTRENSKTPLLEAFIQFVQSQQGQALAEGVGFVSQVPFGIQAPTDDGTVSYQLLSKYGERLSVNFRFKPRSAELDNKAKRDAYRLAEFIKKQKNPPFVQLVGFSEQNNSLVTADILSKLRASAVKMALFEHGVYTESVTGLGFKIPVAGDGASAHRNNRVEVWVYNQEQAQQMNEELERIAQRKQARTTLVNQF